MTPQVSLYALVAIWLLSMALGFKPGADDRARQAAPLSNVVEADAEPSIPSASAFPTSVPPK